MSDITQPLRDEHRELLPHIERLRALADGIGDSPRATLQHDVDRVYEFLTHHLIPHAQAEEAVLYPAVGKILGTPQATATMSRDHVEVSRLTEQLRRLRSQFSGANLAADQITDLRRVLYGLYALVKVHFAKEEELYLPPLDAHLSEVEAHQLMHKMADVAHVEQDHSVAKSNREGGSHESSNSQTSAFQPLRSDPGQRRSAGRNVGHSASRQRRRAVRPRQRQQPS